MRGGGIYQIKNRCDGAIYVGSAVSFKNRWAEHVRQLKAQRHHNSLLQSAWLKFGASAFSFEILESVADRAELICREQYWIDRLSPFGSAGYNICENAGSRMGVRASVEAKLKMSKAHKGRVKSPEHQAAITAAIRGRRLSPEHRAKISEIRRGSVASDEARRNMVEGQKNRVMSEAARSRMVAANIGRRFTAEHKKRISTALCGRKLSDETRDKLRAAALARWGSKAP